MFTHMEADDVGISLLIVIIHSTEHGNKEEIM